MLFLPYMKDDRKWIIIIIEATSVALGLEVYAPNKWRAFQTFHKIGRSSSNWPLAEKKLCKMQHSTNWIKAPNRVQETSNEMMILDKTSALGKRQVSSDKNSFIPIFWLFQNSSQFSINPARKEEVIRLYSFSLHGPEAVLRSYRYAKKNHFIRQNFWLFTLFRKKNHESEKFWKTTR